MPNKDKRSKNNTAISLLTPKTMQTRKAPLNRTKKVRCIQFKEALDFAAENGYIFAVYDKQGDNFVLKDDAYMSRVHEQEEIIVRIYGCGLNFNEFTTADGQHCFRLHNNFNVPKIIPIISRAVKN